MGTSVFRGVGVPCAGVRPFNILEGIVEVENWVTGDASSPIVGTRACFDKMSPVLNGYQAFSGIGRHIVGFVIRLTGNMCSTLELGRRGGCPAPSLREACSPRRQARPAVGWPTREPRRCCHVAPDSLPAGGWEDRQQRSSFMPRLRTAAGIKDTAP